MENSQWIARVSTAQGSGAVLQIVDEFIASHDTEKLATLPAECRPPRLDTPADVASYAYTLARHPPPCDGAPLIEALSAFFARASIRLAEIEAPKFTPRPADRGRASGST